ncbi:MAG: DtxR family transcriptional regulator, partial [Thermodesulfobacteriota bacterium]
MTTGLSASLEDYLQAVYRIQSAKQAARPTDIASAVGVNNSSVTGALRTLSSRGMVNYAPYDVITLTEEGKRVAEEIVRRREVLVRFFTRVLKAEDGEAETTARGVEHAVSGEILERLVGFVEFLELCPRAGEEWIGEFWTRRGEGRAFEACEECIASWEEKRKRAGFIPERALTEMEVGDLGKIRRINLAASGRRRLGERGIRPEAVVRIAGADESGLEILSGGYRIRVRRSDAEQIQVPPFSAPEPLA